MSRPWACICLDELGVRIRDTPMQVFHVLVFSLYKHTARSNLAIQAGHSAIYDMFTKGNWKSDDQTWLNSRTFIFLTVLHSSVQNNHVTEYFFHVQFTTARDVKNV